MLRNIADLENCTIGATDGTIGKIKDCYFDDEAWVIRYFTVDTGSWLVGREVLISPYSVRTPDWEHGILPAAITKQQVMHSPNIDTDKQVSRQQEMTYLGYYGYPYYWAGGGLWAGGGTWGAGAYPGTMSQDAADSAAASEERHRHDDPHLRSCKAVKGYRIHATDGEIGHVQGYLMDERTWAIQYLIMDTSNWWLGHQVLIAPDWIDAVSWSESSVTVSLSRQEIKDSPAYDPLAPLNRAEEAVIYRHYGRKGYWQDRDKREVA